MDVRLPNGQVIRGVPEGTTKTDLRMKLVKNGINPDAPAAQVDPTEGMSGTDKFLAGVGKSFVDTGRGLRQIYASVADAVAPRDKGLTQLVTGQDNSRSAEIQREIDDAAALDAPLMDTGAGVAGNVAGALTQMVAPGGAAVRAGRALNSARLLNAGRSLMAPATFTGAAAQGATFGALQPVQTGGSRGMNAGLGALGGAGGQAVAKTVGAVAKPLANKLGAEERRLAQLALDEGIPLTAADRTGTKPLLAAVMENLPLTSGKQVKILDQKASAFNRAVLKRAGINADEAAPHILDAARKELGAEFDRLSAGRSVPLGDGMLNKLADLDAAQAEVRGVLDTSKIDRLVNGMLDKLSRGSLKGETAQAIRSELTKEAKDAAAAQQTRLADALKTVRNAVDDAIGDTMSGGDKRAWGVARQKYTALKTIQKAMTQGGGQARARADVSPSALSQAVKAADKNGFAYGRGELNDLSRAGELFVRQSVPDSGTAQRMFIQNLITGGGLTGAGGIASAVTGDPSYLGYSAAGLLAPVAVQKVIQSPAAQAYLARGLVENPGLVSELLRRTAIAGGAPLALTTAK